MVAVTRPLLLLPLVVLGLFVAAVAWRLARPPSRDVTSQLVGQRLPAFALPAAVRGQSGVSSADRGPRLINLFASWCVPCIGEVPLLAELRRSGVVIDGIAVKDRAEDSAAFLDSHGNPYRAIGADADQRVQLLLGSSGVPETFLVDRRGIIRLQHIGPIAAGDLDEIRRAWTAAQ